MDVVVVENKEQLKSAALTGNIIIWNGKEEIDDLLEEVGFSLDGYTKANLKLCKEIYFKEPITVEKSDGEKFRANSLSELLKIGSFSWQDLIIVESNDISETIALIQQFINLGIDVNILTREELLKKKVIQNFFEYRNHLKKLLKQFREKVEDSESNYKIVSESKNIISELLDLIEEKIEKSYDEIIKVAVFATKKTGKSMIVNALLGEEYAPTSQELPTPNVIIYKPHSKNYLELLYNGRKLKFDSAKELKNFIRKEFNKVKISGDKLPVMTIFYPKKEGINFEVYDTPGPDLAFSKHGDFINEYIEKADVSVFAVDYTKYAQSAEIELLKKIKDSFDKKGKIYSFVCAINKLDMMYLDTDTEKIKVRVSYFMERKLRELGFKNFVVVPISALIYFYLIKMAEHISEIKEVENLRNYLLDKEDDEDFLEKSGIPVEIFSEISAFTGKIKQIHKIKKPTYKDILKLSGFESFKRYLIYIAQEKAAVEKNFSLIRAIDSYFTQIHNYINSSYAILSGDVDRLKKALNNFIEEAKEEFIKKEFDDFFKKVEKEFSKHIERILEDIAEEMEEYIKTEIMERVREIKENMKESIVKLKRKEVGRYEFEKMYKEVFLINKEYVYEEIAKLLEKKYKELDHILEGFKRKYEDKFRETKEKLKKAINSLEKELNREFSEGKEVLDISIQLPDIDLEFDIEETKNKIKERIDDMKINSYVTIESEIFERAIKGGIMKFFGSFFGIDRYEVKEQLLFNKIDKHSKYLIERITERLNSIFFQLNKELRITREVFEERLKEIEKESKTYLDSIYDPVKRLRDNLDKEREEKQALIEFLTNLEGKWKVLINTWKANIVSDYSKFKEAHNE